MVWKTDQNAVSKTQISEISPEILNKDGHAIGEKKFYSIPAGKHLNSWMPRLKTNSNYIPLKNAISPQTNHAKVTSWIDDAIGYMYCNSNDIQHTTKQTALYSSVYAGGNGFYVVPDNLWQVAIVFSVRRLVKPTWINDRDQFLQPTQPLSDEFKTDCLIWMLFNGSNLTAGADGLEWSGKTWSLVNHFIPFTESEVGAPDRFQSDFMVRYLTGKKLSADAHAVLNAGRDLWRAYFNETDPYSVRDELKLNRPDVGWYQIRNALKKRNASGDYKPVDFSAFEAAYKALTEKLVPMVYELGFLKD